MGFLDKLLGRVPQQVQESQQDPRNPQHQPVGQPYAVPAPRDGASIEDERAIARYQYLLRTAPSEDLERVHTEAFTRLTPEQRQQVLQRMDEDLAPTERPTSVKPAELARAATLAEFRRPGFLERSFGRGTGMGGPFAGSMLGSIAGIVIGSSIANALLGGYLDSPEAAAAGDTAADGGASGDGISDTGSVGSDSVGDVSGAGDVGSSDLGGDFGGGFSGSDFGGDLSGGDFGGF